MYPAFQVRKLHLKTSNRHLRFLVSTNTEIGSAGWLRRGRTTATTTRSASEAVYSPARRPRGGLSALVEHDRQRAARRSSAHRRRHGTRPRAAREPAPQRCDHHHVRTRARRPPATRSPNPPPPGEATSGSVHEPTWVIAAGDPLAEVLRSCWSGARVGTTRGLRAFAGGHGRVGRGLRCRLGPIQRYIRRLAGRTTSASVGGRTRKPPETSGRCPGPVVS
jgi:hypothetical protein